MVIRTETLKMVIVEGVRLPLVPIQVTVPLKTLHGERKDNLFEHLNRIKSDPFPIFFF